jgi:mannose-6-phosphate isomerase-like protein (cupin superfamily)
VHARVDDDRVSDAERGPHLNVPGDIDRSRVTSVESGPVLQHQALLRLWGDKEAGWVNDWVYVSSERLYQIVLSLPPGSCFRHSQQNRTIFGADELYYVLSGRLLLTNPQTGEVCPLEQGEAAWFGPDTWHHGFAQSDRTTRVLEFFAPPPAAGMSQAYARTKPYLGEASYVRDDLLGQPGRQPGRLAGPTIRHVKPHQVLWRLEGRQQELLVGVLLSTERLTVARAKMLAGRTSGTRQHRGDLGLYLLEGRLDVILPRIGGEELFQLSPSDGFFVPAETPYRYRNPSDTPTSFVFAVAPTG